MHNIMFFSRLVFDEFIVKGESMSTKLVELFVNKVVERRSMIMSIFRGELAMSVLGGVDSWRVLEFL
jgi:hypothetical protein